MYTQWVLRMIQVKNKSRFIKFKKILVRNFLLLLLVFPFSGKASFAVYIQPESVTPISKQRSVKKAVNTTDESPAKIQEANFFPPQRFLFPGTKPESTASPPRLMPSQPFPALTYANYALAPLKLVWGGIGLRIIPTGTKMAPNGVGYDPLFTVDIELNIYLSKSRDIYLFTQSRFWAQKSGKGVTNPHQGSLDFSKRQYDLSGGFAWDYWKNLEARIFAYSYNNLNRGDSYSSPSGYKDGVGLSNRFYYHGTNFFGAGYLPSKNLIGNNGKKFKPSWFMENSIAIPIHDPRYKVYCGSSLIGERSGKARLFYNDIGVGAAFFSKIPALEFRTGAEITTDFIANKTLGFYYLGAFLSF